jgi:FkbM family methyltransferase
MVLNFFDFPIRKGFLLEIGVGNVIEYADRELQQKKNLFYQPDNFTFSGSNTQELLELGCSGIYIDPVPEHLAQCAVIHRNKLDRLRLLCYGASDKDEILTIGDGLSMVNNSFTEPGDMIGRKIQCFKTSVFLEKFCPKKIDFFSLDVEGMEDKVLRGIDFSEYQFQLIVVETDKVHRDIISDILPMEYEILIGDYLNTVYVNKNYNSDEKNVKSFSNDAFQEIEI